jgi:hypothetical protein
VRPGTPTLRSIAAAVPSNNPYRSPVGSFMTLPPLQPEPPRAPPRPSRPVAPTCCRSCLSLSFSLSLSLSGLTRTPPSPGRRSRPAHCRLRPGCLPARPLHHFLDHQPRRRRPPPGPARPPQAHARPALDTTAHLPWTLLHPTLSTGRPPMPPAFLSHRPARRPPNSGRRL